MRTFLRRILFSYILLVLLGIVAGYLVFFFAFGRPKVGIIRVPYTVLVDETVTDIVEKIRYARGRGDIKAIALRLDSPGGSVAPSEELFLELADLRQQKPVVMAVDSLAASGGYMAAMGANYLYVKPTSFVGNIGVIFFISRPGPPMEQIVATGPYKFEGGSTRIFLNWLESIKEAFALMVTSQRGERLRLSKDEVVDGRIYLGMEAVRLGLADEIGGEADAIRKAASLAGIRNYGLVDVDLEVAKLRARQSATFYGQAAPKGEAKAVPKTPRELLAQGRFPHMYLLFVEQP
ncbi:MAG: S49 family peptidase [Chloroflexi bacterium]|nr:S49 family peptidase [Chloroflexota bacterium]